jgi:Sulfotransferase family
VFIVGSPRSGTTWLYRLLVSHAAVAGAEESQFFATFGPAIKQFSFDLTRSYSPNQRVIGLPCFLSHEKFRGVLLGVWRETISSLASETTEVYLEKTPGHALFLKQIRWLLPRARFIHVVRDPRAVVASMLAASREDWGKGWAPRDAHKAAEIWKKHVSAVLAQADLLGEDLLEVRYEDLVRDTAGSLGRVFEFLGRETSADELSDLIERQGLARQRSSGGAVERRGEFEGAGPIREPEGFFRRGLVDSWRTELSLSEKLAVWSRVGHLMVSLGYAGPWDAIRAAPAASVVRALSASGSTFASLRARLEQRARATVNTASRRVKSGPRATGSSLGPPNFPGEGSWGIEQGGGHRSYVGGQWERVGRLQFDYLCSQGLEPGHCLLDIGCGSLRGGVHFVSYLDPGNYLGLDKEQELVDRGIELELGPELFRLKAPEFVISSSFEFSRFSKRPDYAIAQSLFSHLTRDDIASCLEKLRAFVNPGTRLFCSFHEVDRPVRNPPRSHSHARFEYTQTELRSLGGACGFEAVYHGDWGHPAGQRLLELVAVGPSEA